MTRPAAHSVPVSAARSVLVSAVAGGLLAASLPPEPLWPLAPLGIALLAHACAGRSWRGRFGAGLGAGLVQFGFACAWVLQFTALGFIALVILESLFVACACAASPSGRGHVPALAALLTLAEWARSSWPFGGLPLGGIALGQVSGPLLGVARLGGPLLVVGATCLAGTSLESGVVAGGRALALRRRPGVRTQRASDATSRPRRVSTRHGEALAGAAGVFAVVALALWGASASPGGPAGRRIIVAVVQGGGRRGLRQAEVPAATVLAAQLGATAGVRRPVGMVVWPEDAVSLATSLRSSPVERLLGGVARRLGATFVVGVTEPSGARHFRNEAVVFGPSGRLVGTYEKVHPVPFGEYVPFRAVLSHLVNFAAVPRDEVPGNKNGLLDTPAGPLALLVSYETFFTGLGRAGVRAGGQLLVVPTNTASYASNQVPSQELAASRLQAVSEGRDLVQAASTGFSAVIDPRGAVLRQSSLGSPDVLTARVALRSGWTLYDRFGELPVVLVAAAAAAAGRVAGRKSAPRRGHRHGRRRALWRVHDPALSQPQDRG